jgi:hypothetical protein
LSQFKVPYSDIWLTVFIVSLQEKMSRGLIYDLVACRCWGSIYHFALNFIIYNKNDPFIIKLFNFKTSIFTVFFIFRFHFLLWVVIS